MPELPEIEVVRGVLQEHLQGRALERARQLRRGKTTMTGEARMPALAGQRLERVQRFGKMLALEFDGGLAFLMHLMLTGRIGLWQGERTVSDAATFQLVFEGPWHVELMFVAARDVAVVPTEQLPVYPPIAKLGPDALAITAEEFQRRVLATRGTLKAALLDQEVVAGIGNAYADEILWEARLHPFTPVRAAGSAGVGAVYAAMGPTLRRAIELRAGYEYLFGMAQALGLTKKQAVMRVHNKQGEPCPACGRPVTMVEKGGRGTFFCEACQPAPD